MLNDPEYYRELRDRNRAKNHTWHCFPCCECGTRVVVRIQTMVHWNDETIPPEGAKFSTIVCPICKHGIHHPVIGKFFIQTVF